MESNEYVQLVKLAQRSDRQPLLAALLYAMAMLRDDKDLQSVREILGGGEGK